MIPLTLAFLAFFLLSVCFLTFLNLWFWHLKAIWRPFQSYLIKWVSCSSLFSFYFDIPIMYIILVVVPYFWNILLVSSSLSLPITQKSTKGAFIPVTALVIDIWHLFFDFLEKVYSFYCWWYSVYLKLQRKVKIQRWLRSFSAKGDQVLSEQMETVWELPGWCIVGS